MLQEKTPKCIFNKCAAKRELMEIKEKKIYLQSLAQKCSQPAGGALSVTAVWRDTCRRDDQVATLCDFTHRFVNSGIKGCIFGLHEVDILRYCNYNYHI